MQNPTTPTLRCRARTNRDTLPFFQPMHQAFEAYPLQNAVDLLGLDPVSTHFPQQLSVENPS